MKNGRKLSAALFALLWMGVQAHAESINIPAVSFVQRTFNQPTDLLGEAGSGILQNATGKYYAPVILSVAGQNICRFTLVYRDFDENNITAILQKKTYAIGGSAFTPPVSMATLQSAGAVDAVRRASTTAISQRTVSTQRTYYFVELTVPFSALQVLGVELTVLPTCP